MARGKQLSGAIGDSWIVGPFTPNVAGANAKAFTSTAEVALIAPNSFRGTGVTSVQPTEVAIPFGCRIDSVSVIGELLASGDIIRVRVRRHDSDPNGTATDVISNCVSGSTVVDYVQETATAVNQPFSIQYTGLPDVQGSTAVGYVEAQASFDAGDYLSVTAQFVLTADSASHVQAYVTLIRDE
jgi:hypothetical protein